MGLKARKPDFRALFKSLLERLKILFKHAQQKIQDAVRQLPNKLKSLKVPQSVKKSPRLNKAWNNLLQWAKRLQDSELVAKTGSFSIDDLSRHRRGWKTFLVIGSSAAAAHILTAVIGTFFASSKPPKLPTFSVSSTPRFIKKQLAAYNSIYDKTFFDREGYIPDVGGKPGMVDLASAKPTTLPLELIGTIVLTREELSVASIKDNAANSIEAYQKDDPLGNHQTTIWKVEHRKVYLMRQNGVLEYVEMPEEGPSMTLQKKTAASKPTDGIRQDDESTFSVSRKFLDQKLENIGEVVTEARAIPAYENGQIIGFRIVNIKKGGVFDQLGIKEGDIVCEVNDIPLNNQGQALSLFGQLKDMADGAITIVYCGGGQHRSVTYNIR